MILFRALYNILKKYIQPKRLKYVAKADLYWLLLFYVFNLMYTRCSLISSLINVELHQDIEVGRWWDRDNNGGKGSANTISHLGVVMWVSHTFYVPLGHYVLLQLVDHWLFIYIYFHEVINAFIELQDSTICSCDRSSLGQYNLWG